jgi:hypothetical protein
MPSRRTLTSVASFIGPVNPDARFRNPFFSRHHAAADGQAPPTPYMCAP